MARPAAEVSRKDGLGPRVLSALVMAPVALAAVYFGNPYFEVLVAVAAGILAWEWVRLCAEGHTGPALWLSVAGCVAAVAAAGLQQVAAGFVILAGTVAAVLLTAVLAGGMLRRRRLWLAAGIPYVGVPCVAAVWLRADPDHGLTWIVWLFLIIWTADIGAYVSGRLIGGPKLAPALSPNKTWAGLGGAVAGAALAGAAVAWAAGAAGPAGLVALAALMGAVEQGGDLVESAIKRRFGAKDSSNLIPGHGGLFDRVDGLIAAIAVTALILSLGTGKVALW
ncbi:MAG: phosphatidate cytidylyltransferase [Hyphomicrobiales bacterium]|nr:phosphatidate cytidylyltransferase [Hyphomicrobiales bacterium]